MIHILFSRRFFPLVLLVTFLTIGLISINSLISNQTINIQKSGILLRVEPATNSKAVASLHSGQTINVLDNLDGWFYVKDTKNHEGWIPEWLIKNTYLTSDHGIAAKTSKTLPIYSKKSTQSNIIRKTKVNEIIPVSSEEKGWLKVSFDGKFGYLQTELTDLVMFEGSSDDDGHNPIFDSSEIDKEKEKAEKVIQVRQNNQVLYSEADYSSPVIYNIINGTKFKLLKTIKSETEDTDFYYVQDDQGNKGYIDPTVAALLSDSIGHVDAPIAKSLDTSVIMLDAGHGGIDAGASNTDDSILEKDINLRTTMAVKKELESKGATVILTRNGDETVSLEDRAARSNAEAVDLFISLHIDSNADATLSGTTTYYYHDQDLNLANDLNEQLSNLTLPNIGIQFGNYYVIRENTRPSILLELGFITNKQDLKIIQTQEYSDNVAKQITVGLENYFKRYQ